MNIEEQFRAQLGPDYAKESKTIAYFFDHAVRDDVASQREGRPVFVDQVYLSKRSALSQSQDEFHRKATKEDRLQFPKEWARYEQVKDNLSRPRVKMLPGISEARIAELQELGIYSLQELVECRHKGYEEWQAMARKILVALSAAEPKAAPLKAVGTGANFHIEMSL